MEVKIYENEFAGKPLHVEVGKLAQQANGSVRVQYGDTIVLATATMGHKPKSVNYFPLVVDYEEKYYAAGKIKGSKWIKRESRPSEEAILAGRLIDRSLRPRFEHSSRNEVQIVITILAFDGKNDPDIPALFAASLALMISDIPFDGPVSGVRIGKIGGNIVINPEYDQRNDSEFDIVIAGPEGRINMIEAGAQISNETDLIAAVEEGFESLKTLHDIQTEIAKDIGKTKIEVPKTERNSDLESKVKSFVTSKLEQVLYTPHKTAYVEGLGKLSDELKEYINKEFSDSENLSGLLSQSDDIFESEIDRIVHKNVLESDKRPDGRGLKEVRKLSAEIGILPHSHGTGLFDRGSTQALSVLTLAAPGLEQWIETMEVELTKKRYMHHYVFPPFSVGEVGRMGGAGRRDIGHGALAERALLPLIPDKETFPYTIRVVSEILSSNGSSSMASVCGSTLALLDGGVPIKAPAAGIAMGLMLGEGNSYKILTDIQGPEDHHGDMDLKVAGTSEGVTAMQMDVKISGITVQILKETLDQAKEARLEILKVMNEAIEKPRNTVSQYAPRIKVVKINPEKIGALIGPGGKVINQIIDKTGVSIDIEEDGSVFITGDNGGSFEEALKLVDEITYEAKSGDEFEGKVTRLLDFGAMVEYVSGKEGLVHVSEISAERIKRPSDVLKVGQVVHVKVKNVDEYGRINLTMRK